MEEYQLPEERINSKNQQVARSILNVIIRNIHPVFGVIISESIFDYWGRIKQDRVNAFGVKLKEYFETVSDQEIDEEFLRSEDFAQFFEMVIRKVSETKSEEKLKIFRDILINNIQSKEIDDFSETFLNLVSQLQEKQIKALDDVRNFTKENKDVLNSI